MPWPICLRVCHGGKLCEGAHAAPLAQTLATRQPSHSNGKDASWCSHAAHHGVCGAGSPLTCSHVVCTCCHVVIFSSHAAAGRGQDGQRLVNRKSQESPSTQSSRRIPGPRPLLVVAPAPFGLALTRALHVSNPMIVLLSVLCLGTKGKHKKTAPSESQARS
jgi:hypothetical protein